MAWTIEFYLGFYDFWEEQLLRVIEESRTPRKMLASLDVIFIGFIPNMNELDSFEDYMPISLCNIVYKIIVRCWDRNLTIEENEDLRAVVVSKDTIALKHKQTP
jgi:hypothetical protein